MKKLIALIILSLTVLVSSFAQNNKLTLNGFPKKGTNLNLAVKNVELTFDQVNKSKNSRATLSAPNYYVLIERKIDNNTTQNYNASKTGKIISKATVIIKDKSNKQVIINLNSVLISDFKIISKNGETLEAFKLRFESFTLK